MNEKTANAGDKKDHIEVCIGQMIPTEKGIEMPPQYAYKIDFKGKDVMVIPLEGKWKSTLRKHKLKEDINVTSQNQTNSHKSGNSIKRKNEKEDDEMVQ